jgi:hypothetical protein
MWFDAILAFESAAELGQCDEMAIYGITATSEELGSENLHSFGRFSDCGLRDYDYDVRRQKAQERLLSNRDQQPNGMGPMRFSAKSAPGSAEPQKCKDQRTPGRFPQTTGTIARTWQRPSPRDPSSRPPRPSIRCLFMRP